MTRPAPLAMLLRLRHLAVDEAKRALADALKAETHAAAAVQAARAAIGTETEAASALTVEDAGVEAFARWLPQGRAALVRAEAVLAQAEGATLAARARLTAARAAADAVDQMMQASDAAARAEAELQAQNALDEIGQRSRKT